MILFFLVNGVNLIHVLIICNKRSTDHFVTWRLYLTLLFMKYIICNCNSIYVVRNVVKTIKSNFITYLDIVPP
jgi:hypothetical protein